MSRPHAASLIEDAWHTQLERVLRRRRWANRVLSYTGYGSTDFVRVFGRVVLGRPHEQDDEPRQDITYGGLRSPYVQRRGWRAFLTAPAMTVPVEVHIGDRVEHVRSDRSGLIDATIRDHGLPPGWHEVTIAAPGADPVKASVMIIDPQVRTGIVSDIDDTVLSTSLPRPMIAAWNTFFRHESARRVVPGMAPLYRALVEQRPGVPIIYLSTGAWNTAPTLTRFLRRNGFPAGPLLLTDWGPTNTGWFRSGQDHKRASLDRLAGDFPRIKWLLIGDDGQHDPKIYQDFAEARPKRVEAIAIRQLTPTEQVLSHGLPVSTEELATRPSAPRGPRGARGSKKRRETPVYHAPDGYGLLRLLRAVGKLR
ncbi:MAG TPA: DUF2183 domain-containing protein [Dermatophilaceae bacterium]|jgi:phosphatidate phosphatase APP1|nr:DUF2183 domain-containing protein [Actinomycetales bacterium]HMT32922.1 DUF2183 domain-containing protein [Dermatophilaceae bacterium]HMT88868.1 DUF2183 domain-containing protein [Dermatophilaceae bacterium]